MRFEEFDVERIRVGTGNSMEPDSSDADDLLDHREVIEVGPVRPDLSLTEVGDADAGQLRHAVRRPPKRDILVEDMSGPVWYELR